MTSWQLLLIILSFYFIVGTIGMGVLAGISFAVTFYAGYTLGRVVNGD
jgi:hypothetical protein